MNLKLLLLVCSIYQITATVIKNGHELIEHPELEFNSQPFGKDVIRNPRIIVPFAKNMEGKSIESRIKMCKLHCDYNWYIEDYNDTKKCFNACCQKFRLGCSAKRRDIATTNILRSTNDRMDNDLNHIIIDNSDDEKKLEKDGESKTDHRRNMKDKKNYLTAKGKLRN